MATNRKFERGDNLFMAATTPTTPVSGDPVLIGQIPGVALTDENSGGLSSIQTTGVFALSVKGENAAGNVAVGIGVSIDESGICSFREIGLPSHKVGSVDVTVAVKVAGNCGRRSHPVGDAEIVGAAAGAGWQPAAAGWRWVWCCAGS